MLSTCNRSELYGVPENSRRPPPKRWKNSSLHSTRLPHHELNGPFYRWAGPDAVRHLFRVASGLDSMLLGEAEILGQLRTAYNQALDHGATGPVLNRIFQGALEVGKRVRSGNGNGHAADVRGAGGRETRRASFRKLERSLRR